MGVADVCSVCINVSWMNDALFLRFPFLVLATWSELALVMDFVILSVEWLRPKRLATIRFFVGESCVFVRFMFDWKELYIVLDQMRRISLDAF